MFLNRFTVDRPARRRTRWRMRSAIWFGIVAGCLGAFVAVADEPKPLQQQIDELRKGQEQILKELGEIRQLLKQRDVAEKPAPPSFLSINVHGEPFRGNAKARVAILEYSDFDCGYCAQYATEIFPQLNTNYIASGKVKYFFRDMPSPEHPTALFKAKLARCAGEQGKLWEMHDYLFAHQQPISGADIEKVAAAVGVNPEKLGACVASEKYMPVIQRSLASADKLHIQGTPAFIIGTLSDDGSFLKSTEVVVGSQSYGFFQKKLDELLVSQSPTKKQ
jgi:protein-disulfide isomerase